MISDKQTKQQIISIEVIKVIASSISSCDNEYFTPFHEAFLKAFKDKLSSKVSDTPFLISLSSWMHGLNTTLGRQFFEKTAHILSNGEKREYTSKKLGNLKITKRQRDNISEIISRLSIEGAPSLEGENEKIFIDREEGEELLDAMNFSADVFFEDEASVVAIELKSVKPNSGEMRGEKQKILEGKAALFNEFKGKKVEFFVGFPFDPTADSDNPTSYDKKRFLDSIINMTKSFHPDETLLAGELWDKLSGEPQTMEEILEIINRISTPEFLENFRYLAQNGERGDKKYSNILKEWNIFSELELLESDAKLQNDIKNDKRLTRLYNQRIFDDNGDYNFERYFALKNALN